MIIMKNTPKHKVALIGGDARQLICASRLKELGFETNLYGFSGGGTHTGVVDSLCCSCCPPKPHEFLKNLADGSVSDCGSVYDSWDEAIADCMAVVLPLPASTNGTHVSMPLSAERQPMVSDIISSMKRVGVKLLFAGKLQDEAKILAKDSGIEVFDYYERDEFAISNAVPTAEGAIEIAMHELPVTLDGASALVIGNGRIGKVLARLLSSLGVKVTVSARKASDFALIRTEGHRAANTEKLASLFSVERFDMVFNTVPHIVLGKDELKCIAPGTLIVDLASKPGGVDNKAAAAMSHNVIWALSLPGKVAPVTSGRIIADTIFPKLEEYVGGK